jgi:hypothetical protein
MLTTKEGRKKGIIYSPNVEAIMRRYIPWSVREERKLKEALAKQSIEEKNVFFYKR